MKCETPLNKIECTVNGFMFIKVNIKQILI